MKTYPLILLSTVLSNLFSALIIFFYFAYIDVQTFVQNKLFWRGSETDWTTFAGAMVLGSGVIWLIGTQRAHTLQNWENRLLEGEKVKILPQEIRQWAVSFPIYMALASLGVMAAIGAFFGQGGLMFFSSDASTFWRTFLGVGVVGGMTTLTLVFLITDTFWHHHLPHFFPSGDVGNVRGPRVTVGQRLVATLVLTGFVPLVVLGVAANNSAINVMDPSVDPYEVIARLQALVLFIVGVSILSNFVIGGLTTNSLLGPLRRLSAGMARTGKGDLALRLPVDSNDEIGDLTARFNGMLRELEQGQRMRDLFGRYVSKEIAAQVLKNGAELGGVNTSATTLFADIRDFTGLSERLPAQEVVSILNRYYTRMVDVIVAEGGLVNKFGGDSLLAIFGVPIRQPDHALRAVRAALQMTRALAIFNAEQASLGLPSLSIGVGIASGEVVAGNVGGEARLEYTVIGDPVNLASRLQTLTKELGEPIILSHQTQTEITTSSNRMVTKLHSLGKVDVRGKQQAVEVFALKGII